MVQGAWNDYGVQKETLRARPKLARFVDSESKLRRQLPRSLPQLPPSHRREFSSAWRPTLYPGMQTLRKAQLVGYIIKDGEKTGSARR